METDNYLFPVYQEGSDTAQFFVSPAVVPPGIVSFGTGDRYGRKGHFTQYLAVPLEVPNYVALCQEPGQIPWDHLTEINPSSLQVLSLIVSLKVNGVERYFFVNTERHANTGFVKALEGQVMWNLNMRLRNLGGADVQDSRTQEKVGWDIFTEILTAGYEPMLNIALAGSFDRQRNALRLTSVPCGLRALRNVETSEAVFEVNATEDQLALLKSVTEVQVVGVRMHQLLEERPELPIALVPPITPMTPSPMAKKFEEIVKGSGYWKEVDAEYKPYDSFDIEQNVPLALAGNPNVIIPDLEAGWIVDSNIFLATYKTPYPGTNPKRFQAFVLSPKANLIPHYPIASVGDLDLRRSDEERYFTSLNDTITCYLEAKKRGVQVFEIAAEFNGRTAQEMIDYFKPFDEEPRNTFPKFPSDSQ
jgi:hypothetical protein